MQKAERTCSGGIPVADIGVLYHRKKQAQQLDLFVSCLKELSVETGRSFFLFSIGRFDPERKTAQGLSVRGGTAEEQTAPVPSLICNFALHTPPASIAKMRQLRVSPDHLVINPINRFHQLMMFDMLRVLPSADEFLLPFRELDQETAAQELAATGAVIILPQKGGSRRTAAWIQKGEERCLLQTGATKQYVRAHNLPRRLQVMLGNSKRMLTPLPQVICGPKGTPLEARVYTQKDGEGKWQVVQMAAKRELFAGLQEEPKGWPLWELLVQTVPDVAEKCCAKLSSTALQAAGQLDVFLPNVGTLTFDFLIGQYGDPLLAAVSGWEQGDVLREACGTAAFTSYVRQGVAYSLYLHSQSREGGSD